jgi:hypothetical protein
MLTFAGVMAMEVSVLVDPPVTLRVVVPLTPIIAALTAVDPAATPVAMPLAFTVAIELLAAAQVAAELMFAVEPSLYVAVAVNCSVAPTAMLGVAGVTAIDVSVFAGDTPDILLVQPVTARVITSRQPRQSH